MKKLILITGLLTATTIGFGQTAALVGGGGSMTLNPTTAAVGIGTNSPIDKLHVIGGTRLYQNGLDGINTHLYLANVTNDKAFNFQLNANTSSSVSLNLWSFTSGPGWSNRFTFTQTGALGIGTTTPIDQLHVIGGIRSYKGGLDAISPQLYLGNAGNTKAFSFQLNGAETAMNLWAYNSGWNNRFAFTTSGCLGIGVGNSAPLAYLHVKGPDQGTALYLENTSTITAATQINVVRNDQSTAFSVVNAVQIGKTVYRIWVLEQHILEIKSH